MAGSVNDGAPHDDTEFVTGIVAGVSRTRVPQAASSGAYHMPGHEQARLRDGHARQGAAKSKWHNHLSEADETGASER